MQAQEKDYKNPPEVRVVLARVRAEQRARVKQKEAEAAELAAQTASASKLPQQNPEGPEGGVNRE